VILLKYVVAKNHRVYILTGIDNSQKVIGVTKIKKGKSRGYKMT